MDNHVHSSSCYTETHLPACYEYRLAEMRTEIVVLRIQNETLKGNLELIMIKLREAKGLLDRIGNVIKNAQK